MGLEALVRRMMPLPLQDAARLVVDATSPRRHRERSRHALAYESNRRTAERVSPTGAVLAGPFAGTRLPTDATWGGLSARLAGTYEHELAEAIEGLIRTHPSVIVDIGCAEGYYAAGLARRLPTARVLAYDLDPAARKFCRATKKLNACANLRVRGRIDARRLNRVLVDRSLVLSDCEGFELELLRPSAAPRLRKAWILAELHEFLRPGSTEKILERFSESHDITVIDARPRRPDGHPQLAHLPGQDILAVIDEGRDWSFGPQQWAIMHPRESRSCVTR